MLGRCAVALLGALCGCASVQQAVNGYEAAAAVSLRAAQDNAIDVWVFTGCATPYSAALRNPRIIPALRALCGQSPAFDQVSAVPAYTILPPEEKK